VAKTIFSSKLTMTRAFYCTSVGPMVVLSLLNRGWKQTAFFCLKLPFSKSQNLIFYIHSLGSIHLVRSGLKIMFKFAFLFLNTPPFIRASNLGPRARLCKKQILAQQPGGVRAFPFEISRQICFFSEVGLSDQCPQSSFT
jgi:hypothetical protein